MALTDPAAAQQERRAELVAAASEVRLAVLSGRDPAHCLELVRRRAAALVGADRAVITAPGGGQQVGPPGPPGPPGPATMSVPLGGDGIDLGRITLSRAPQRPFDLDDVQLLSEFARLVTDALEFGQLRRDRDLRAAIDAAGAEILWAVLSSRPMAECLDLICRRATLLLAADLATVLTPAPDVDQLLAVAVHGASSPAGRGPVGHDVAWRTIRTGEPAAGAEPDGRAAAEVAVPLRTGTGLLGALVVARAAGGGFSRREVETLTTFAGYATTTLEVGRLRADRERLARLEERERIARDLHDGVIQNLFASGIRLASALGRIQDPVARARAHQAVAAMDAAVDQLRATIFQLADPPHAVPVRIRLERVIATRALHLGFRPELVIAGDPERLPADVVGELIPVINEALSNAARHADADSVTVGLAVSPHGVWELTITDDGVGFDRDAARDGQGLANLGTRAALLGAELAVLSAPGAGTRIGLRSSPLPAPATGQP